MKRREFLRNAGAGLAGAAVAAPAVAQSQSQPQIRWRMASSFPKALDALYGTADQLARRVARMTDGKFEIRVFAAGEIVPPLQVLDAVQNGTVECGQTAGYYYIGKNPALAFDYQQGKTVVSKGGDMAYSTATYTETMTDPKTGKPVTTEDLKVGGGGGIALRILRSTIFTFNFAGGPDGFNFEVGSGWMF